MRDFCKAYFGTWLDEKPTQSPAYQSIFAGVATHGTTFTLSTSTRLGPR